MALLPLIFDCDYRRANIPAASPLINTPLQRMGVKLRFDFKFSRLVRFESRQHQSVFVFDAPLKLFSLFDG